MVPLVFLLCPIAIYSQSFEGFSCSAAVATPPVARATGTAEKVTDTLITCTGGTPTPAGQLAPLVNITVSLDTQIGNRLLGQFQTDALLLINDPQPPIQSLCVVGTPAQFCPSPADGNGGGKGVPNATDYNGSQSHPNIFQGTLVSPNEIVFFGVPIDPPGPVLVNGAASTITFRLTGIRFNAAGYLPPTATTDVPVHQFVSTSAGFPISNPIQVVAYLYFASPFYDVSVSSPAAFAQCAAQTLQPAFTVSATESDGPTEFATRFYGPMISSESIPGNAILAESGFLVSGLPLTTSSPDVADFGTRIKLTFGNTPPGVTLYVPLTVNLSQTELPSALAGMSATLTATEAGPFSAVPASQGTNGMLAAVMNGVAIYEITSQQSLSSDAIQTFSLPVYLSYSAASTGAFPTPGTGTVNITLAPTVLPPNGGTTGPVPAFIDNSMPLSTYTITPCAVSTLTPVSATPQSTAINTAFASPLQASLQNSNGNPVANFPVTFTLPTNGPGALFADGGNIATVSSNTQGIATSPQIIANSNAGSFIANATTGSVGANFSLTNLPGTSTVTFAAIPNHLLGDSPFVLKATASPSPAPIVFTVLSGPAVITGNVLSITGLGAVTVQASQAATASYQAASAAQSFTVSPPPSYSQTITFPPIPDHNATDAPFIISASASSGLPVKFTVVAGPATINGNVVTLAGTGIVSIEADQPGNTLYPPAASTTNNFHVFGPAPSITSILNGGYNSSILAPNSYGELFGTDLATQTISNSTPPFPVQSAGLTLILTDARGVSTPLPLYYVSPTQIDVLIPANVATGAATLRITNASARTTSLNITIANVSPGLFSADGTGKGPFAGQSVAANGQIYVALYGTGFRNAKNLSVMVGDVPAQVLFSGPQDQFPGLDQVNITIPYLAAPGSGQVNIVLTADGVTSNSVTIPVLGGMLSPNGQD
jgi:uncharacterized protein (TIGR03437 family)